MSVTEREQEQTRRAVLPWWKKRHAFSDNGRGSQIKEPARGELVVITERELLDYLDESLRLVGVDESRLSPNVKWQLEQLRQRSTQDRL